MTYLYGSNEHTINSCSFPRYEPLKNIATPPFSPSTLDGEKGGVAKKKCVQIKWEMHKQSWSQTRETKEGNNRGCTPSTILDGCVYDWLWGPCNNRTMVMKYMDTCEGMITGMTGCIHLHV